MQTYDLLEELKLDKAHLARYSPRPHTVSARRMADDVPEEDKKRRHQMLDDLQAEVVARSTSVIWGRSCRCWWKISTKASGADAPRRINWCSLRTPR
jgi:tRNA A37 methylthiotransferase MiaB